MPLKNYDIATLDLLDKNIHLTVRRPGLPHHTEQVPLHFFGKVRYLSLQGNKVEIRFYGSKTPINFTLEGNDVTVTFNEE